MKFSSQIFSLIPFYMAVASYCYYKKVRRTMPPAIVSYLLKYLYSFSAAELNNIEREDEVFALEFSWEESDYVDSDDEDIKQLYIWQVNNKYFPLHESSSLY